MKVEKYIDGTEAREIMESIRDNQRYYEDRGIHFMTDGEFKNGVRMGVYNMRGKTIILEYDGALESGTISVSYPEKGELETILGTLNSIFKSVSKEEKVGGGAR